MVLLTEMRSLVRAGRCAGRLAGAFGVWTLGLASPPSAGAQGAPPLSPLADSIAAYLVFVPSVDTAFLAATRAKRLLVDIGHVDINVLTPPRRRAAYREAVAALSPLPAGTKLRLVGPWGTEDAAVRGFDSWNGRIVATLATLPGLDSLVRSGAVPVAVAYRIDSLADAARARTDSVADSVRLAAHGTTHGATRDSARDAVRDSVRAAHDSCRRDSLPPTLVGRVAIVRDSIDQWLRAGDVPPFPRLVASLHSVSTQIAGCFGGARRLALAVDIRAGSNEWIRERVVLLDTLGRVTTVRVDDYRFRGHDLISAFDADGDGIDDLATRGYAPFSGGLAVLRLGPPTHLRRLVSGFAWDAE